MTGTLSGYLVYRLQDGIKKRTRITLSYDDLIEPLTDALLQLDKDMLKDEFIELPTGTALYKL